MVEDTRCQTILIAVADSNLENAIKSIALIKAMQEHNLIPIIASEGGSLQFLKKEFPYIKTIELPNYAINVNAYLQDLNWKLTRKIPAIALAILKEKKALKKWTMEHAIDGIISIGRLGLYSSKIPSVYITQQLCPFPENANSILNTLFGFQIKKFSECWLQHNILDSGKKEANLGFEKFGIEFRHINIASRMHYKEVSIKNKLLVLLSGNEPHRTLLEQKIQNELVNFKGKVVFVKGLFEKEQQRVVLKKVTYYNYMTTKQLETVINESDLILCRPEESVVADLIELNKKAFFIIEPENQQQLKLAHALQNSSIAPFALENNFKIENLESIKNYKGFSSTSDTIDWKSFFKIFKTI
ncbi:glycosyltransferase [Flavobacterium frigidarium]|uniref:glycosyltransferase n=1 Tax=Flavobacterium frigidarium TaxID=99286 RepID=UPI0004174198|nr:glycosyltransferase [Flavobacterium frigidarium]